MSLFTDITADIVQTRRTGLLSVVTTNGKHHLKIFFSEGEIYYLLYGDVKDADCLTVCEKLEMADCFFTNGVKVATNEKCSLPTATILNELRECFDKSHSDLAHASVVPDKLKVALVRQIGPIGELVFSAVLEQWQASSPPTREQLAELVFLLGGRIEDDKSRKAFATEANNIIS